MTGQHRARRQPVQRPARRPADPGPAARTMDKAGRHRLALPRPRINQMIGEKLDRHLVQPRLVPVRWARQRIERLLICQVTARVALPLLPPLAKPLLTPSPVVRLAQGASAPVVIHRALPSLLRCHPWSPPATWHRTISTMITNTTDIPGSESNRYSNQRPACPVRSRSQPIPHPAPTGPGHRRRHPAPSPTGPGQRRRHPAPSPTGPGQHRRHPAPSRRAPASPDRQPRSSAPNARSSYLALRPATRHVLAASANIMCQRVQRP